MKYFSPVPKSLETLKKQYKKLSLEYHPDVGGSDEAMKAINQEYTELFGKLKTVCFNNISERNCAIKAETSGSKMIKCLFTATRDTDRAKLHLLNLGNTSRQWAVCWNYDMKTKSWTTGTYCSDFSRAVAEFRQKCAEYQFGEIFENYR